MSLHRLRIALLVSVALLATLAAAETKPMPSQGTPGTVTISLPEYDRLVERAAHPPKPNQESPVPAALSSAVLDVLVGENEARGRLTLTGDVLRRGVARVPLVTGATLLDARLGTKALPLKAEGGTHAALLDGPQSFTATLDVVAAVTQEPGRASITLPLPLARSTRLSLTLPRPNADVRLEGGIVTRRTTTAGQTTIEATLEAARPARASWTARDNTPTAPREARWVASIKTLATVGEADLRVACLVDVTVVQGDPGQFSLALPQGFELTSLTGASFEEGRMAGGRLTLRVADTKRRRHQFLVALERSLEGETMTADVPLLSIEGTQRETGEVAVEGLGTLDLESKEEGNVNRMDVREASGTLLALARQPLLAAFRYHRRASEPPRLTLVARRFPDAPVLAAVAERADVTTLLTVEGRILSEVALTVRNHAQPFLRVTLPEGVSLLSAEVAGEKVKPVLGTDGTRVPLLRPGYRPTGPYNVSFVYIQSRPPLAKRGEAQLTLPRLDLPVNVLIWEVFTPERYKVEKLTGTAVADRDAAWLLGTLEGWVPGGVAGGTLGGVLSGRTDRSVTPQSAEVAAILDGSMPRQQAPQIVTGNASIGLNSNIGSNFQNFQQRIEGVLPVEVQIPRAGRSQRFVRPLVLDEETTVAFRYKTR